MTARILQFQGNNILEYSLIDGTVTTTSLGGSYGIDPRRAIFNWYDNKIYAQCSDGRMMRYNPYTNEIELVSATSVGWWLDVTGDCVWCSDYPDIVGFSTVDFSEIHRGTDFYLTYATGNWVFSAPGRRIIVNAPEDPELPWYGYTTYSIVTFTSYSSYSEERIGPGVSPGLAEDLGLQAPYIYTGDKFFVGGGQNLPEEYGTGIIGSIMDLTNLTFQSVYAPGVDDAIHDSYSPRWDRDSNVVTIWANHFESGHSCGATVDVNSGVVNGTFGETTDLETYDGFYDEPNYFGGGLVIGWSSYNQVGFFNAASPTRVPISSVPGEDFEFVFYNGITVVPDMAEPDFWTEYVLTYET